MYCGVCKIDEGAMLAGLGEILYRGGSIGAAIIAISALVGILLNVGHENGPAIVKTLTVATVAWGIGRTALHFLAGR